MRLDIGFHVWMWCSNIQFYRWVDRNPRLGIFNVVLWKFRISSFSLYANCWQLAPPGNTDLVYPGLEAEVVVTNSKSSREGGGVATLWCLKDIEIFLFCFGGRGDQRRYDWMIRMTWLSVCCMGLGTSAHLRIWCPLVLWNFLIEANYMFDGDMGYRYWMKWCSMNIPPTLFYKFDMFHEARAVKVGS